MILITSYNYSIHGVQKPCKNQKKLQTGAKVIKNLEKTPKKITAEPMGHLIKASRHGVCSFFEVLATFAHTLL
jgi:hypothetical protein